MVESPTIKKTSVDEMFLKVVKDQMAGDPMREGVYWTNLSQREIAKRMEGKGVKVSTFVVKQLLKEHSFGQRKIKKQTTMKNVVERNKQFKKIAQLKKKYQRQRNPVVSVDTKKKEFLGIFYREGKLYTQETLESYDHDFQSFAEGVVVPYGIYDLKLNHGYLYLGTSRDTSEFACENVASWWQDYGKELYPKATSILWLCDGGGSNNSRHYIFKEDLQKLVNQLGIEIRIAHYPAYCSKYNPIEHCLFPHVTKAMKGVMLTDIELARRLISNTSTSKGLTVTVNIIDKTYNKGRKATSEFRANISILFDAILPRWNYRAVPAIL